jgi:adenine-specific DNA-methyltransferase
MTHRIGGFQNGTAMTDESLEKEPMGNRGRGSIGLRSVPAAGDPARTLQPKCDAVMSCEDNLEFMRPLESESIQLIVTSPPYNIGKKYESKSPLENYIHTQGRVISECVRLLRPGGSLCWQVGNHVHKGEIFPLDLVLYPIFREHGLKLRNRIIWHFEHGLHCSKRLSGRYETILWFTKSDDYIFNLDAIRVPSKYPGKKYFKGPKVGQLSGNPLGKNPGDVWIFPNVKNNHVEKTIHPCQFPVELVERLVLSLTNRGDSMLDPYMGVGSAVVAALKHGRVGYGCDVVPEYVEIAWGRIRQLRAGVLKSRPMDKPVYDPTKPHGGHKQQRSNGQRTIFEIVRS